MAADYTFDASPRRPRGPADPRHPGRACTSRPTSGGTVAGVPGVVTAVARQRLLDPGPAARPDARTSEGIFVFTARGARPSRSGTAVDGQRPRQRVPARRRRRRDNLTITEIVAARPSTPARHGDAIAPTLLGAGGRAPPTAMIDDDALGDVEDAAPLFDPRQDGIDFHESLEGMLVRDQQPGRRRADERLRRAPGGRRRRPARRPRTARGGVVVTPRATSTPSGCILDDGARPHAADRATCGDGLAARSGRRRLLVRQLQVLADGRPTAPRRRPPARGHRGAAARNELADRPR